MILRFIATISLTTLVVLGTSPTVARADAPPSCTDRPQLAFTLLAPTAGSSNVATDLKTIYVAMPGSLLAQAPPMTDSRLLVVDDAGETTEGGVLRPTSLDELPSDVVAPDSASNGSTAFAYAWIPALRASTHYVAMLARLDAGNCTFARLGDFSTRATI